MSASVSERRIKPIQEAVEDENWKQALQLCEKWHKKGEKSDHFLAVRAFVFTKQHDGTLRRRGTEDLLQLCRRTPAITDTLALHQIQDTLKDLSLSGEESTNLWARAVAAAPDDKDLNDAWFQRSLAECNWQAAQKAAMALRKGSPKERKYDFWNIVLCFIISLDLSTPEHSRSLFGTLAYRFISKAAEAVPTDKTQLLSSGKAIQTPDELCLLVKIFTGTGHAQDALNILKTDRFGRNSRFAEQDAQLVEALLMDALEAAEAWDEAFTYCDALLNEESADDLSRCDRSRRWKLYVEAATRSNSKKLLDEAMVAIQSKLKDNNPSRSVFHAAFSLTPARTPKDELKGELLQICKNYCHHFRQKTFAFEDLKGALTLLDTFHIQELIRSLTLPPNINDYASRRKEDTINTELCALKLRFYFLLPKEVSDVFLESFTIQALRLYQTSLDGGTMSSDAALLASLSLLRLASLNPVVGASSSQSLLQATFIQEICRSHAVDYYPALLLLVRIQCRLGLISLFADNFKRLSVKNMQWDTVGHLLLTRISTLHPSACGSASDGDGESFDPSTALSAALNVSDAWDDILTLQMRSGLKNGSYPNVIDSLELRKALKSSISTQLYACERARIGRLLDVPIDKQVPLRSSNLTDNRDFSALPSFATPKSCEVDESLRCGPVPGSKWLDAMKFQHEIYCFLKGEVSEQQSGSMEDKIEVLRGATSSVTSTDFSQAELTSSETQNLSVYMSLGELLQLIKQGSSNATDVEKSAISVSEWLEGRLVDFADSESNKSMLLELHPDLRIPTWEYLHRSISTLEVLQTLALFISTVSKRPKSGKSKPVTLTKDHITKLQQLAQRLTTCIHDDAGKLKLGINAQGVIGTLVDTILGKGDDDEISPIGKLIEKISDMASLETFCGAMRASWEDALDGILAVKVKWSR